MIAPSTQDVVSGGGSFAACLHRAIRRPLTTLPPSENNVDIREDDNDCGNDVHESTPRSRNFENQDWTTHHISYTLLSETLDYFSQRRDEVTKRLRSRNPRQNISYSTLSEGELAEIVGEFRSRAPFNSGNYNDLLSTAAIIMIILAAERVAITMTATVIKTGSMTSMVIIIAIPAMQNRGITAAKVVKTGITVTSWNTPNKELWAEKSPEDKRAAKIVDRGDGELLVHVRPLMLLM